MGTYLVVDGNSLTYRAFFALPTDMATASGQVTNAVFGFTSMLINVLKDHTPDGVLVAFDRPEPTFRHEAEPLYKAQREAAPDILRQQMGLVREVLDAVGITAIDLSGWEADDIIATATDRLVEAGHQVIIVTGDRDSYQLVRDPDVKVLYNKRGVSDYAFYDEAGIEERTGVAPSLYVQYAALRGDNSDNLPGVPGVGEKTAAKLINTYGGLDGIFEHVDDQTPKLRSNLAEHEERARKNLELMQLRHDAPIDDLVIDDLGVTPNADELKRLFDFLEFRTLAGRLDEALSAMGTSVDLGPADERAEIVAEVTTAESPAEAAASIASAEALDIAATWVGEPGRSPLAGIAVVLDASVAEVLWIPADVLADDAVRTALGTHGNLRGHNVKPLMRSLLEFDVEVRGLTLDTAIAAYLIDPAEARYTLPDLIEKYTKFARPSDDAAGSGQLDLDGTSLGDAELASPRCAGGQRARRADRGEPGGPGDGRAVPDDREPARVGAREDGARRRRGRRRGTAGPRQAPVRRGADAAGSPAGGRGPRRPQLELAEAAAARSSTTSAACRRARRPRPATRPTPPRSRRSRTSGPSSWNRCCATARSRSCAAPTARGCSPRSPPTGGSTRRSTRPSPAPDGCRRTSRTSTTSRCAPTKVASSARRSCPLPAPSCSSPTTTRSSCAASPTSRRTPV